MAYWAAVLDNKAATCRLNNFQSELAGAGGQAPPAFFLAASFIDNACGV
jgi:hypothetical protein